MRKLFVVILVFVLAPPTFASTREELLQLARNGYRQTRESITSISAHIRVKTVTKQPGGKTKSLESHGQWIEQGSSVRWNEDCTDPEGQPLSFRNPDEFKKTLLVHTHRDYSSVDGQVTCVNVRQPQGSGPARSGTLAVSKGSNESSLDPWSVAGFLVQDKPRMTLMDALENREWAKDAELVLSDGEEAIHVTCLCPDSKHVEAWLSPSHGFLAKRLLLRWGKNDSSSLRFEYTMDKFAQPVPGIFFPCHSVKTTRMPGSEDPQWTVEATIGSIVLNKVIPAEAFRLTIPPGTATLDLINDRIFIMGEHGKPSSKGLVYPIIHAPSETIEARPTPPTRWSFAWWGGGIGLAAAGAIFIWRLSGRHTSKPQRRGA